MSYDLQAVIVGGEMLRGASRGMPAARLASIGQGLALMPMTDALFDSFADADGVGTVGFWRLSARFGKILAGWPAAGPVATWKPSTSAAWASSRLPSGTAAPSCRDLSMRRRAGRFPRPAARFPRRSGGWAQWLDGEHATRTRWHSLVTARRERLRATP